MQIKYKKKNLFHWNYALMKVYMLLPCLLWKKNKSTLVEKW